jgi:hypothetical protein
MCVERGDGREKRREEKRSNRQRTEMKQEHNKTTRRHGTGNETERERDR